MFKQVVIIALFGVLSGCAHVRVEEWSNDQLTICGNQWAGAADFETGARQACGGRELTQIGAFHKNTGLAFKSNDFGLSAENTEKICRVYACR